MIGKKPAILRATSCGKGVVLLLFWAVFIPVLIAITANNNGLNASSSDAIGLADIIEPLKNGIRGIRYVQYDLETNKKPIYSLAFDELLVENNDLGVFKTGLFKAVKIAGLELKFYQYTSAKNENTKIEYPSDRIAASGDLKKLAEGIRKLIKEDDSGYVDIDLNNAVEVKIRGFDYSDLIDGKKILAVHSKRASASGSSSDISLRGHVVITTANGSCLESNNVTWDIKNKQFTIAGGYVLNRGKSIISGKDICVDQQLNAIGDTQAKLNGSEELKCCAKL